MRRRKFFSKPITPALLLCILALLVSPVKSYPCLEEESPGTPLTYLLKGLKAKTDGLFAQAEKNFQVSLDLATKAGDISNRIQALLNLGVVRWNLGHMADSRVAYEQALELAESNQIQEQVRDIRRILEIFDLYDTGKNQYGSGDYPAAITTLTQAVSTARELQNIDLEIKCLRHLSIVYLYSNDLKNLYETSRRAHDLAVQIHHDREISRNSLQLGIYFDKLGNYTKALTHYENALELFRKNGMSDEEAACLNNMSIVYKNTGNYDKSIDFLHQALEIDEITGFDLFIAKDLNNLGDSYRKRGLDNVREADLFQAREYFFNALYRIKDAEDPKTQVQILNNIGTILSDLEDYSESRKHFLQALELAKSINDKESMGMILNNLGIIQYNLGNYEESSQLFQESIALAQELNSGYYLWEAYLELAKVYIQQSKNAEAIAMLKESVNIIEAIRYQIESEELKASFFGSDKRIEAYHNLIAQLVHSGNKNPHSKAEAFFYLEKAKARAFLDRLKLSQVNIDSHIDFRLKNREIEIEKDLSLLMTKLYAAEHSNGESEIIQQELKNKEYELDTLRREIRGSNPAYADLNYPNAVTLREAQAKLIKPDTTVFEYMVGKESALCFVINRNNLDIFPLPSREKLAYMVSDYLKRISDPEAKDFSQGSELYDLLVAPGLQNKSQKIIIVPDDILNFLPFETLIRKAPEKRWLVQDFEISYIPSLSSLKEIIARKEKNHQKHKKNFLAFGDPDFGEFESSSRPSDAINGNSFDLQPLKFSGVEIEKILNVFKQRRSSAYTRENATEDNLKSLPLEEYKIIHFATHSFVDDKQPSRSYIALTMDGDPAENGFLNTGEIYGLRLNADLVTLSACETGLGKFIRGEGIEGINRAFFFAGTSSVLMSLWPVNDQATSQLMERFYGYLRESKSIAHSLRSAKLEMIGSEKLSHPYYWAGFVVSGKGSQVVYSSRKLLRYIIVLILLIIFVFIFFRFGPAPKFNTKQRS